MVNSTGSFTMITNNMPSNPIPHMVVHFVWLLCIDKHNIKLGRVKGCRQKLRYSNHKGKYKIWCYLKSLLIFTAYQIQWWCNMILIPVKISTRWYQFREILINISWHTYLKNSEPHTFILQKVKNPLDGFFIRLFFASAIILIFGGIFLHRISSLFKVKIKCIRVTKTYFTRQKFKTSK